MRSKHYLCLSCSFTFVAVSLLIADFHLLSFNCSSMFLRMGIVSWSELLGLDQYPIDVGRDCCPQGSRDATTPHNHVRQQPVKNKSMGQAGWEVAMPQSKATSKQQPSIDKAKPIKRSSQTRCRATTINETQWQKTRSDEMVQHVVNRKRTANTSKQNQSKVPQTQASNKETSRNS